MKVSSISSGSIESTLISDRDAGSFTQTLQHLISPVLKTLNRIGTSIALGEAGDLEASHEFRKKNSGK
jgi:hypothetical protein